jgi:phage terminase small subunit
MKRSLYNITREAIELASQLEEGELTPEMETALSINQNELQEKAINYAYAIKSMEDDVTAIKEEIKRLQAIETAKSNAAQRMKQSISNAMEIYGIDKVTSPTLNLSFRRSESVEVDLVEALSNDFKIIKTTVTADKVAIKQAIKQGENITGARIVEKFNLQIK